MNTLWIKLALIPTSKEWLHEHQELLVWLGSASIVTFLLGLFITPLIIVKMSEDYFLKDHPVPDDSFRGKHPVIRWTSLILKNLLGFLLVLAGIAMLALPGQGLLTILLGLVVMNFPGKRKLELRLIHFPGVLRSINWIRAKAKHAPLRLPDK